MAYRFGLAAGLLAAASLANASGYTDVAIFGPGSSGCAATDAGGRLISAGCSSTVNSVTTTGSVTAVSAGGHLGVEAHVETKALSSNGAGGYQAVAYAQTMDRVRIDGRNGEQGQGILTVAVDLAAQRSSTTQAPGPSAVTLAATGWELVAELYVAGARHYLQQSETYRVDYRPETGPIGAGDANAYVDGVAVPTAFGRHTFLVPFTFGTDFDLMLELRAYAFAGAAGDGQATMDLNAMNSFDWAGIQSVSAGGQGVAFTIASQSGIDWVSPVPEPASVWLTALGLAGCLVAAKRGRNKPLGLTAT